MRLDRRLQALGKFASREKARRAIKEGRVRVSGRIIRKPAYDVGEEASIELLSEERYLAFGGVKLETALNAFKMDVSGKTAIDVGSSTGGFTDCLLQHGAKAVLAVDTGTDQLHEKLRSDPRVESLESTNFHDLDSSLYAAFDVATVDVSFTSSRPIVVALAKAHLEGVVLLKPQFETDTTPRKGVIRDSKKLRRAVLAYLHALEADGVAIRDAIESPRKDPRRNREFLVHFGVGHAGSEFLIRKLFDR